MMIPPVLYVVLGGAIGSTGRYYTIQLCQRWTTYPIGTVTVNIIGSLLMGLLIGYLAHHGEYNQPAYWLLATGVLGGYTTFSAFSLDIIRLLQHGDGITAMIYMVSSVALALLATFLGMWLMR